MWKVSIKDALYIVQIILFVFLSMLNLYLQKDNLP
jgi:hypothetical protein